MNMKMLLPLIGALALAPLLATHNGSGLNPSVGSWFTQNWQLSDSGSMTEQGMRGDCVAVGADPLRRAAPPVIGAAATSSWQNRSFAPQAALVCTNS